MRGISIQNEVKLIVWTSGKAKRLILMRVHDGESYLSGEQFLVILAPVTGDDSVLIRLS